MKLAPGPFETTPAEATCPYCGAPVVVVCRLLLPRRERPRFDKRAYQREYMRKWRAATRERARQQPVVDEASRDIIERTSKRYAKLMQRLAGVAETPSATEGDKG